MKALVFNLKKYARILRANIVNTFQAETAYFGNNWGNLLSTISYTLTLVLFINVLYARLPHLAGYDKNEMLFLVLIAQASFYISWALGETNNRLMIEEIRNGNLDFLLLMPVSSLWLASTRKILILSALRDALPTLAFLAWLVNWGALPLVWSNFLPAALIFICGQFAWASFSFLLVLPVFWHGESSQFYSLSYILRDTDNLPWEGYANGFKALLTVIVPTLVAAVLATSVALGRSAAWPMLGLAVAISTLFWYLKWFFWQKALANYTSAS